MPDKQPSKLETASRKLRAAEDAKRRKAMGPPQKLSDQALEEASQVREADVESSVAFWRKNASPAFKDLLDAEVVE